MTAMAPRLLLLLLHLHLHFLLLHSSASLPLFRFPPSSSPPTIPPFPAIDASSLSLSLRLLSSPPHRAPPVSFPDQQFRSSLLSGSSFPGTMGQYFAQLYVGTPPRPFLLIVDTGSDVMWLPCSLCEEKGVNDGDGCKPSDVSSPHVFVANNSSTFAAVMCPSQTCFYVPPPPGARACHADAPTRCTYAASYHDGTKTSGVFGYDTVTASPTGSMKLDKIAFGCSTEHSLDRGISAVGGLLGLSRAPISFSTQLGQVFGHTFSYCFTSFFHKRNVSSSLSFGSHPDPTVVQRQSPTQYTPFVRNPFRVDSYYLGIESVRINGVTVQIPSNVWSIRAGNGGGGTMIDSGTTLTFFRKPAYDAIVNAITEVIPYPKAPPTAGLDLCYNVSGFRFPRLPRLSILFDGGAIFSPPPNNYFLRPESELRCLGFMEAPSQSPTTLGNLLQQNFHVEYDRKKNRLGFAKARCATPMAGPPL